MSSDRLLLWLSARQSGSTGQLRRAIDRYWEPSATLGEWRGRRTAQVLRHNLHVLAHVEFELVNGRHKWRVTPPGIAVSARGRGVLCGYRSAALVNELSQAIGAPRVEVIPQAYAPGAILIDELSCEEQRDLQDRLGIQTVSCAPSSMLGALPPIRSRNLYAKAPPPTSTGWVVSRFSPTNLAWVPTDESVARRTRRGLFRWAGERQRVYRLFWGGTAYATPLAVAKYLILSTARRNVLHYDAAKRLLSVPAICRLPALVERAVVLSSGFLPLLDEATMHLNYQNIDDDSAATVAALLRQEAL